MRHNKDHVCTGETTEVAMLNQEFGSKGFYREIALISGFDNGSDEPKNFTLVSKHKNQKEWWDAMCTEFQTMESKEVGKTKKWNDKPSNRKLIGNQWVDKLKDNVPTVHVQ